MDRGLKLQDVLALQARHGDDWCRDELIRLYQPMLGKFSRALLAGMESTDAEDLRQIGVLAIMEIIDSFDGRASFTTFAFKYLPLRMRRMADGQFQDRIVAPPVNKLSKDRARIRKGEEPQYKMRAASSISNRRISGPDGVDVMTDDEALASLAPDMVQEDTHHENVLIRQIWECVDSLPAAEAKILRLYFGNNSGLTLDELASICGITRQGVNCRVAKALARLQSKLGITQNEPTHRTRMRDVRTIKAASRH